MINGSRPSKFWILNEFWKVHYSQLMDKSKTTVFLEKSQIFRLSTDLKIAWIYASKAKLRKKSRKVKNQTFKLISTYEYDMTIYNLAGKQLGLCTTCIRHYKRAKVGHSATRTKRGTACDWVCRDMHGKICIDPRWDVVVIRHYLATT